MYTYILFPSVYIIDSFLFVFAGRRMEVKQNKLLSGRLAGHWQYQRNSRSDIHDEPLQEKRRLPPANKLQFTRT